MVFSGEIPEIVSGEISARLPSVYAIGICKKHFHRKPLRNLKRKIQKNLWRIFERNFWKKCWILGKIKGHLSEIFMKTGGQICGEITGQLLVQFPDELLGGFHTNCSVEYRRNSWGNLQKKSWWNLQRNSWWNILRNIWRYISEKKSRIIFMKSLGENSHTWKHYSTISERILRGICEIISAENRWEICREKEICGGFVKKIFNITILDLKFFLKHLVKKFAEEFWNKIQHCFLMNFW